MAPGPLACPAWTGSSRARKAGRPVHTKSTGGHPDRPYPASAKPRSDILARHAHRNLDAGPVRFCHNFVKAGLRIGHNRTEPGAGALPGLRDCHWGAPWAAAPSDVAFARRLARIAVDCSI